MMSLIDDAEHRGTRHMRAATHISAPVAAAVEPAPPATDEHYRRIVENVLDGIWTIDADGLTTFANANLATMFGYTISEMLGRLFTDFMDDASKDIAMASLTRRQAGVREEMDFRFRHKDGRDVWTRLSTTPLFDDAGRFNGALAMVTDITVRRAAERALREHKALLELVFNTTTDAQAMVRVEPDGRLIFEAANAGYMAGLRRIFPDASLDPVGRERSEFLMNDMGMSLESAELELPYYREAIEQHRVVRYSIHVPNAGGARLLEITLAPALGDDGRCKHLLYNARDVTEQDASIRALRESEQRLREAQRIGQLGLLDFDLRTNRVLLSDETIAMFGLPAEEREPSMEEVARLLPSEDRDRVIKSLNDAIAGIADHDIEHRMVRPDGTVIHVYAKAELMRGPDGAPLRLLGTVHNITARKKAETDLNEAASKLRASLREKETLLREIHHRVKNNLQVIAGLLHFQAKKLRAPEDAAALGELRQRIFAMTALHERLYRSRDVARIEFGDYLRALVAEHVRSNPASDAIRIEVNADEALLPIELAMPSGLIVSELVNNVLKHASRGRVGVRATVSARVAGDRMILQVDDDGVGLPEGFDAATSGSFGWELIRGLVAQLDGTASATTGPGTHVEITFPAPSEPKEPPR